MNWIKNLKITKKMLVLCSITIISLVAVGGISLWQISKLSNSIESVYSWNVVPIEIVSNMKSKQLDINTKVLELLISKDKTRNKELLSIIEAEQKELDELRGQYNANIQVVIDMFTEYDNLRKVYHSQFAEIIKLANANKIEEAFEVYTNQLEITASKLDQVNTNLIKFNSQYAKDFYKSNQKDASTSITIQVSIVVFAILLAIIISLIITKSIIRPVDEMKSLMQEAEKGDLTVQSTYKSNDEIGILAASFNQMLLNLKGLIDRVRESSEQVAASSEELMASAEQTNHAAEHIAEASMELAEGSDNSLKGTQEASTSVKEMEDNIINISESISKVFNNSKVTSLESEKGHEAIQLTVEQMKTVNQSVLQSANIIKSLGIRSKEIEKIVAVISDISEQTNLLALNAAIEAARAGEHGKGFAVVADEVRKLAEESRSSAEQITSLIRNIQENTNNAVSSMEKSTEDVETGMQLINTTSESFQKIYDSANNVSGQMKDVSTLINSITENATSLALHINLVSKNAESAVLSTQSVASGAEEQLATIEEISASSDNLANMAEALQKMVRSFKV